MSALISNKRLRESFIASCMPATDIALFAGFTRLRNGNVIGDDVRLKRSLGLEHVRRKNGKKWFYQSVTEETALAIAEALNLDPVDIGL